MGLSSKEVYDGGSDWRQSNLLQAPTLEFPNPTNHEEQTSEKLQCPRCGSSNTKFCYYNNYNRSQPRHFCKSCKRHWTKGGTLRNVPVGGGRNKNKRIKTSKNRGKAAKSRVLEQSNNVSSKPDPSFVENTDYVSIDCSNNSTFLDSISMSADPFFLQNDLQDLKFPFKISSSCSLDANPYSFQTSSVAYSFTGEITEEPGITSVRNIGGITDTGTCSWNWDDIDGLVCTDFNIPWNDSEIKP